MYSYIEMSLKEQLVELLWKYGWKNIEEILPEAKEEVVKRSLNILNQLHCEVEADKPSSIQHEVALSEVPSLEEHSSIEQSSVDHEQPKESQSLQKKKKQREREKEKRLENESNGIFAKDLLTKENLQAWKDAKHSNAYIAREFVGCREEEVAKAIKKFNVGR